MLKVMRDQFRHLKIVLWFVVAVFILLIFVDWGTGRGQRGTRGAAVRVGNTTYTEAEFLRRVRANEDRFRQLYGNQWEQLRSRINLAEQTAAELIQRALLVQEARRAGLVVSDDELRQRILSYPAFRREDGGFVGPEAYARILRAFQTTPEEFERELREDLLIEKLQRLFEDGVAVTDAEVTEALRRQRESASFDLYLLRAASFRGDVDASDAEIAAYYEAHREEFRRPEQRVLRYLLVSPATLRRLLPVSEEELRSYYDAHRDEFSEDEMARARHILIRVAPEASPEEVAKARAKAEAIARMARAGANFAELARKHSDDQGSRDRGGDLGWFGRGRMVKEFEEAVFSAKPGEIVGPIRSQFGFHVIKVEGHRPARVLPFEEAKDRVRWRVAEGRAAAEAEARARALAERLRREPPADEAAWQKIADEDEAVSLNVTPPFAKDEVIPGIGDDEELRSEVFAAKPGEIGGPHSAGPGWIVWQLAEVKPAGIPPLSEVREQVAAKVLQEKALEKAREAAGQLAEAWRGGADAARLEKIAGGPAVTVTEHRRGQPIPGAGRSPEVDRAVFLAKVGDVVGPVVVGERAVAVARITGLKKLSPEELRSLKPAQRQRLRAERARQLRTAVLNERRKQTVIAVDEELIKRFAPQASG